MTELVERLVASTGYSWTTPNPDKAGEVLYYTARHGERVQVSAKEAERGEGLGCLVDEEAAARRATEVSDLQAEVERLQRELATARQAVPPALIGPPPAPAPGVTLTPDVTGIPQTTPLPDDVGPIGPTSAAQVAAARAATGGAPVISVTPAGDLVKAVDGNVGDVSPALQVAPGEAGGTDVEGRTAPARLPGQPVTDDELRAYTAAEMAAYVSQHSDDDDELERIDELEAKRSRGPRKTVTDALDTIRQARAAAGE